MRRAGRRERRWLGFGLPPVGVGLKSSRLGIGDIDLTGRKQKVNVTGGRVALELLSKGWYSSLDSNQEHYSIGIASNYYSIKSSSLIVISKNITCLMGLGGIRWQNIRLFGESLRRLKR